MNKSIPEKILDMAARRFGQAEVFVESGESQSVDFEDNRLKEVHASQFEGVGLRVIHEGRIGFAATSDLRDPARLVEMAAASAEYGDRATFELPGGVPGREPVLGWDEDVPDVTAARMVEMGNAGLEMSRAANDEYLYFCGVSRSTHHQRVLNTSGLDHESSATSMSCSAGIQEVNENGILYVYDYDSSGHPIDGVTGLMETVLEKARLACVIAPVSQQRMPIVFIPQSLGTLLAPLGLALNGKMVQKGASVLHDRLGEQVLDARLSIVDDPTIPFSPGACAVDDEGTPARKRPLFEDGVLRGFLSDLQTAGLLGWEPGGNGFRGYGGRPAPSVSNSIIAGGDTPFDNMVGGMERGLIVEQTLGGGQSNTMAGEFSVNVSLGFLVENGSIVGRVKDCMVAGNVYELLRDNVEALGRERRWIGGSLRPAIMVGGITLAVGG